MSASLNGCVIGPDGRFDWSIPDAEVLALASEEVRGLSAHQLGRHLHETMVSWDAADTDPLQDGARREFARVRKQRTKVVLSTTLTAVRGSSTRLATAGLTEEIERLRAESTGDDIGVGGARLAAEAEALGLIDEYRISVYPVLVGGGVPFFAQAHRRVDFVESRTVGQGVMHLRHRTSRR